MDTVDPSLTPLPVTVSDPSRAFPILTAQQMSRIARHGQRRQKVIGEVLVDSCARRPHLCRPER